MILRFAFVAAFAALSTIHAQFILADSQMSGWTSSVIASPLSTGPTTVSTGSATLVANGNSDSALQVTNNVGMNSTMSNILNSPLTWNPATQGAINTLGFSIDVRGTTPCSGVGHGFVFTLTQAGIVYVGNFYQTTGCVSSFHSIVTGVQLNQSDFDDLGPGNNTPDFSISGGLCSFGFRAGNSTTVNGNGYTISAIYDNFQVVIQQALYPGTSSDFDMLTATGANSPDSSSTVYTSAGSFLSLVLRSPNGLFHGSPVFVAAQASLPGMAPAAGPTLWLNPFAATIIIDGLAAQAPFGSPNILGPLGLVYGFLIPNGLGGISVFMQSAALSPSNGFALSNAIDVRIL